MPPSIIEPKSRWNFFYFLFWGGVQHPKYYFDIVNTDHYMAGNG